MYTPYCIVSQPLLWARAKVLARAGCRPESTAPAGCADYADGSLEVQIARYFVGASSYLLRASWPMQSAAQRKP